MIFALATICLALVARVALAFFLGNEALSAIALILLAVLTIANWIANI